GDDRFELDQGMTEGARESQPRAPSAEGATLRTVVGPTAVVASGRRGAWFAVRLGSVREIRRRAEREAALTILASGSVLAAGTGPVDGIDLLRPELEELEDGRPGD